MAVATNLGFPRIGRNRALKWLLEAHWRGERSEEELQAGARALRLEHWRLQQEVGMEEVPVGDFSLYDHVLDTMLLFGVIPERYRGLSGLRRYFAMARGDQEAGIPALEMTKWFDTNYHYLVPEFPADQAFRLERPELVDQLTEARAAGFQPRPVLLGPITFYLLAKGALEQLSHVVGQLLPAYGELLAELRRQGASWIQIDEPYLPLIRDDVLFAVYRRTFEELRRQAPDVRLLLTSYFAPLTGKNLDLARQLPVDGLHLDLTFGKAPLSELIRLGVPEHLHLSLGVVNGRNVWCTDLGEVFGWLEEAAAVVGTERLFVAPSSSLLFLPIDLDDETRLPVEVRRVLAFAKQKLEDVTTLSKGLRQGREAIAAALEERRSVLEAWRHWPGRRNEAVQRRLAELREADFTRPHPYAVRREAQQRHWRRPLFPTTTIGSFPQTEELRRARAKARRGELSPEAYQEAMRQEIARVIRLQEEIGLDVLVHGEPERNDMVEYFAELLDGFLRTEEGWVQSYGSRCVKPPILFGDVSRKQPMTVEWLRYAQSLTEKPVKGMLTGPVTILKWSFVREDQPLQETALQLALVLRDEVLDLEAQGLKIIQIDEPAYREAAPLVPEERDAYFAWASRTFRLVTSGVKDETQVQSHMCYSEFNDILPWIAALDADVLLIEASRSKMELLPAFRTFQYPNEIGPGVYDIHSPRVPSVEEIEELLRKALTVLDPAKLWVNPDCGLKTRRYEEVVPSLRNMVAAAKRLRRAYGEDPSASLPSPTS